MAASLTICTRVEFNCEVCGKMVYLCEPCHYWVHSNENTQRRFILPCP